MPSILVNPGWMLSPRKRVKESCLNGLRKSKFHGPEPLLGLTTLIWRMYYVLFKQWQNLLAEHLD